MQKHDLNNKLEKIVVNVGVGRLSTQPNFDAKVLPDIIKDLTTITGQKPSSRPAMKSISGFKLRQGTIVGLKTTLRGARLKSLLSKVVNVTLPRVRDFRGISKEAIDQNGNLNIGLKEHIVFPEISPEHTKVNFGMQFTLVPMSPIKDMKAAVEFYKTLGIPFKK